MVSFNLGGALSGAVSGYSTGGWAGAGAGAAIGGFTGDTSSHKAAKRSWKYWNAAFDKQKAWEQEKMQNAHQWEMQDLLETGLNPALTAGGTGATGSGAPNPSLMPEFTGAESNNKVNTGLRAIEIAQQNKKLEAEIGNITADTGGKLLNNDIVKEYGSEQAKRNLANTLLQGQNIIANTALAGQERATKQAEEFYYYHGLTPKTQQESAKTNEEMKALARGNRFDEKHPNLYGWNRGYGYIRPAIQDIGMAGGLLMSAKKVGGLAEALKKTKVTEHYNKTGKFKGAMKSWYE